MASDTAIKRRVGRRLRACIEATGKPITHIADMAGVGHGYLWSVFDGEENPSVEWLCKLADVLRVDVSVFFQPDEPPRR